MAIPGVRLRVAWVRITAAAFAGGVLAVTALPMPAEARKPPQVLFVTNWGPNVSVLRVGADGWLAPARSVAPAPPTPTNPAGVALTPDGRHLYVANFNGGGPGTVSAFRVGPSDALVPTGLPAPTGGAQPDFGGLVLS